MRGLIGVFLLATGVYVGSYMYFPAAMESSVPLAQSTQILASVERDVVHLNPPQPASVSRSFSPARELKSQKTDIAKANSNSKSKSTSPATIDRTVHFGDSAKLRLARTQIHPDSEGEVEASGKHQPVTRPWTTVVTVAPPNNNRPMTSSTPADGASRYALIRDIQKELKRVGCYHGKIDGDWGPGSKRAMVNFIGRVNATLPTRNPDFILLSLVQSQRANICGTTCAPGQIRLTNGQCGTRAIVAQRNKILKTPTTTASIAKPPKPTLVSEWRTVAIAAETRHRGSITTPPAPRAAYRQPLPGRMTVGGPPRTQLSAYETRSGVGTYPPATQAALDNYDEPSTVPNVQAKPRKLPKAVKRARAAKKKARARRASKSRKRRYYRKRRNPLRSLLTQGVY